MSARTERASVEVWRDGPDVWLSIRSMDSVGKAIALSRDEARSVAAALTASSDESAVRRIKDEPQS